LENLSYSEDRSRSGENIKEKIETSAKDSLGLYELKQHKTWFDKECLGILDLREQAKMQWVQDPNRRNLDNLNLKVADISGTKEGMSEN
jgi:hypothetical protein